LKDEFAVHVLRMAVSLDKVYFISNVPKFPEFAELHTKYGVYLQDYGWK
jgi:hypothetical protein